MIGRVAIWARGSTWKVPMVSARQSISKTAGSSLGIVARSTGWPRCERISRACSIAASMPSPSRSIFTIPMSSQSSLSHWTTVRPGMVAGCKGTTRRARGRRRSCRRSAGRGGAASRARHDRDGKKPDATAGGMRSVVFATEGMRCRKTGPPPTAGSPAPCSFPGTRTSAGR